VDFFIGTLHAAALGDHPGTRHTVDTTGIKDVVTLGYTIGPGSGITEQAIQALL
jgi:hypothetical protein